ncbi:MAG: FAD-binding protein, partial [Planctomycetota bacterium]
RVLQLDEQRGLVEAEAGIFWPELMNQLDAWQSAGSGPVWTIRQKQTGVDDVSLGGSLSANIHGRGLRMPPMVADIEAFTLMNAQGRTLRCTREENANLFRLAIGGYGCFGVVLTVTLRLQRRQTLQRRVQAIRMVDLPELARQRIADGALYGDCQYATHLQDTAEEHRGILATYHPVEGEPDSPSRSLYLTAEQWAGLYKLARTDKPRAFQVYTDHYLRTNGLRYASDRHQLSPVFSGYLAAVGEATDDDTPDGTEIISEFYCEPDRLMPLLADVRRDFAARDVDMTYGTIRFIQPDHETFLPWARRTSACVVVNLHVRHDEAGVNMVRDHVRRLFDCVLEHGGSFYLTYHRWATRAQLDAAYPEMPGFLREKRRQDPGEVFARAWYRHIKSLYPDLA